MKRLLMLCTLGGLLAPGFSYAEQIVGQASFSTEAQSIWKPGPGILEFGFKKDLVDTASNGSVGAILDAKIDLTSANFEQDIQFLCPVGSFLDLTTGGCYECPAGYNHNPLLSADNPAVCSYISDRQAASFIGAPTLFCPSGQFPDPIGGSCYSCPEGYSYDAGVSAVTGEVSCSRTVQTSMDYQADIGCANGDWGDLFNCFECPAGYSRITATNSCSRTLTENAQFKRDVGCDAGEFDGLNGNCYTCPDGYSRVGLSLSCERTSTKSMTYQRTKGCGGNINYLGKCYTCPSNTTFALGKCTANQLSTDYDPMNHVGTRTWDSCASRVPIIGTCIGAYYCSWGSCGLNELHGNKYFSCPTGYTRVPGVSYTSGSACIGLDYSIVNASYQRDEYTCHDTLAVGTTYREYDSGTACYECTGGYVMEPVPSGANDSNACIQVQTDSADYAGEFGALCLPPTEYNFGGSCYACRTAYVWNEGVPSDQYGACSTVQTRAANDVGDYRNCDELGLNGNPEVPYQGSCYECPDNYSRDAIVLNPNHNVCNQLQTSSAPEHGDIQFICNSDDFYDVLTGDCHSCGEQSHDPLWPASSDNVCYTLNESLPNDTGTPKFLCPLGTFTDVVTGGCYSCPENYVWNPIVPVSENGVCFNVIAGENLSNPTFQAGVQADFDFAIRWGLSGGVTMDGGSAAVGYDVGIALNVEKDMAYSGPGVRYLLGSMQIDDDTSLSMNTTGPGVTAFLDTHMDAKISLEADVAYPGISELGQFQQERYQFTVLDLDTQGEKTPSNEHHLLDVAAGGSGIHLDLLGFPLVNQPSGTFSIPWNENLVPAPSQPKDPNATGDGPELTASYQVANFTLSIPNITTPPETSCLQTSSGCLVRLNGANVEAPPGYFGEHDSTVSDGKTSITNYLRSGSRTGAATGTGDVGHRINDMLKVELDLDGLATYIVQKATAVPVPLGANFGVKIPFGDRVPGGGDGESDDDSSKKSKGIELFSLSADLADLDAAVYLGVDVEYTFMPNLEVVYLFSAPVKVEFDGQVEEGIRAKRVALGETFMVYTSSPVQVSVKYSLGNNQFASDTNMMVAPVVEGLVLGGNISFIGKPASLPLAFTAASFAYNPVTFQVADINFYDDADKAVFALGGFEDVDGPVFTLEANGDADGDDCPDNVDAFPNDPTECVDTDGDLIGDNADPDRDGDNLPNVWEEDNGTNPLVADADSDNDQDMFTAAQEFAAGTDADSAVSTPTGANGIVYVEFSDDFDDGQYEDRWYLSSADPNMLYSLFEAGSELQATTQPPALSCNGWVLESYSAVDLVYAVFHARIRPDGYGTTSVGLVRDNDYGNRIEVRVDNDDSPYLRLRSWVGGIEMVIPVELSVAPVGVDIDVRLAKRGDVYHLFVNNIPRGEVTNVGLGNTNLRPFIAEESCLGDGGFVDTRFDLVEVLLDRDGDGRADILEDSNIDGAVGAGESDPLNPDMDDDQTLDGFDNCLLESNAGQVDSDGDLIGNRCDPDLNNDDIVTTADFMILRSRMNTNDPDADLNGDGVVSGPDYMILRSQVNQAPGPSGLR